MKMAVSWSDDLAILPPRFPPSALPSLGRVSVGIVVVNYSTDPYTLRLQVGARLCCT